MDADTQGPEAEAPTKEAQILSAIDDALAPALAHAQGIGTASLADLGVIVRSIRQALSHVVYGPPEPVEPAEPFDAVAAAKAEALKLQQAEQAAAAKASIAGAAASSSPAAFAGAVVDPLA